MTVRDLIQMDIDIDVYDDVCEELGIAFCGPQLLTEEGEREFSEVMNYKVTLINNSDACVAIVRIDDPEENVWMSRLDKARRFFYGAAGFCSCSDYDRWFKNA